MNNSAFSSHTVSSNSHNLAHLSQNLQLISHKMSKATMLPSHPALISPHNSSNDLQQNVEMNHEEQQQREQEQGISMRPIKKRKLVGTAMGGPASTAVSIFNVKTKAEEAQRIRQETAVLRRKELAAKLRARGVTGKIILKLSDYARSIFLKNQGSTGLPIELPPYPNPSQTDLEIHAKHSQVLYNYVRKGTDLEGFKKCVRDLQKLYHENQTQTGNPEQQPFRCSNRFGESLMHLACRRGRTDFVRFLVEELHGVTPSEMLSIRDDCHKTPLHDACWTPSPNFELVELILKHTPEQMLMEDVRGNTPFDYVRKDDYSLWLRFLWERRLYLGIKGGSKASSEPLIPTN